MKREYDDCKCNEYGWGQGRPTLIQINIYNTYRVAYIISEKKIIGLTESYGE